YLLALSELGIPGFVLWTCIIYITTKIPIAALKRLQTLGPEAEAARTFTLGLLAAICGLLVGILLLSFSYHPVLWIFIGLSGALYCAVKRHDPEWQRKFGGR